MGGKAASLERLARLGFEVPPGFALTTAAFDAHLAAISDMGPMRDALVRLPDEAARVVLVTAVADAPLPERGCRPRSGRRWTGSVADGERHVRRPFVGDRRRR